MPMNKRPRVALLVLAFALAHVPRALADPITVTGGSTFGYWDGSWTSATLSGPGLAVNWPFGFGWGQSLWPVGSTGNLNGAFTYDSPAFDPPHTVTVNGVDYSVDTLVGTLSFATPSFLVEYVGDAATFTSIFSMTGFLRGLATDGTVLFDVGLAGTGTATANASYNRSGDLYQSGGVLFEFADAAPTPEPATLLLLGTGLAAVAVRHRRSRFAGRRQG